MKRRSLFLLPFLATPALSHSYKAGDVKIGHAWCLPALAGQDGQAFMPMLNTAKTADALVAARSEKCLVIQMRRNARYDDPPEPQFDLAFNKPLAMRPQAVHLRLVGLRSELKRGDRFELVLDFLNVGEVAVEVYVEDATGH